MSRRQTIDLDELEIRAGDDYGPDADAEDEASAIVDEFQPQIDALRDLQTGVESAPAIPPADAQAPSSSGSADPAEVARSRASVARSQQEMDAPRPITQPPEDRARALRLRRGIDAGSGAIAGEEHLASTDALGSATPVELDAMERSARPPLVGASQQDATKAWSSGRDDARPPTTTTQPAADPRLAALPSEGDITGARAADVPRRILRALAAGLRGRPSGRPYEADVLAERRREGLARIADQDAQQRAALERQGSESAAEAERQRFMSERQAQQLQAQRGMVDARLEDAAANRSLRERSLAMNEQRSGLAMQRQQAELDAERALSDAASPQSAAARRALMTRLASVTDPALRESYASAGLTPEAIQNMSAADIAPILAGRGQLVAPATLRDSRRRGTGGGMSVGGASASEQNAILLEEARRAGLGDAARAMSPRDLRRFLVSRAGRAGGLPQPREELIEQLTAQGVSPEDAEGMSDAQLREEVGAEQGPLIMRGVRAGRGVDMSPTDMTHVRNDLAIASRTMRTLREIGEMARRGASLSPDDRVRILPMLNDLGSYIARNSGTGVINTGEWDRFREAMPNPTSHQQDFLGQAPMLIDEYLRSLETNVRTTLRFRSVSNEGQDEAMRQVRAGSFGESMVRIRRRSDGREAEIPRSRWQRYSEDERTPYEEVQ